MVKIVWPQFAIDDLKSIHRYICLESKVYANRTVEKLIAKVHQLEIFPETGRTVPEFGRKSIGELIEGNYRIVYKIHNDNIGIVRVHHSARLLK